VPSGGAAEVARAAERVCAYYTLVGLPAAELAALAAERPGRYSPAEWMALLDVRVPGRSVDAASRAALAAALEAYYTAPASSAGQRVAEFFGEVGRSVQAPVQNLGGSMSAGLRGGLVRAGALLGRAAGAAAGGLRSSAVGDQLGRGGDGSSGHEGASGSRGDGYTP
jgi:hypothetical protein